MTNDRLALIGYGAIARSVIKYLLRSDLRDSLVSVLVRPGRAAALRDCGLPAVETVAELLSSHPTIVSEIAGQDAVHLYGENVLCAGADFLIASVGSLADDSLRTRLQNASVTSGARILICSGAVGGIDAISAMRLNGLRSVTYRSRKPPSAWKDSKAEMYLDLATLTEPVPFFRGSARYAALNFPKNANVAATIALAGVGMDATEVELIADPNVSNNIHEIEALGDCGNLTMKLEGKPSPDNPRTSELAALSIAHSLTQSRSSMTLVLNEQHVRVSEAG